jgi:hypothetical protein
LARERSEQQQQATDGGGRQRWRHVSHLRFPPTDDDRRYLTDAEWIQRMFA